MSETFAKDPIIAMRSAQLNAGAIGWAIGMVMLIVCLVWEVIR